MPRQVEGDDAIAAGDLRVVQDRPVLPAVGAGGVQAEERNALARLLEVDAMRLAVQVQAQVAADHRLDHGRADCSGRRRHYGRTQRGEELLEEQEIAPVGQHVAVDPQVADPLHGDQALEAGRRHRLGELRPTARRGGEAEGRAGRRPRTHGEALARLHRRRLIAAQHREGERRELRPPLQGGIAVEGRAETRKPSHLNCPA
jgi:hypothetical protein